MDGNILFDVFKLNIKHAYLKYTWTVILLDIG